ncbi:MAG: site-specific DNA-methyltransferase [Kiritimatiellae bacterium]|nr:site-specific DNA-methyltransferase [Kiritimatiellia bacterium]
MSAKFIPFFPEPVKGQAILNNFTRTLRYYGNDAVKTSLRRGMPLYEMRTREHVGTTGNSDNLVIRGECLSACAYLKDKGVKVDLVYIDPPFASGADYAKKIVLRRNPLKGKGSEIGAEITDEAHAAFEEKMYGDIWDKEKYLNWMYENLRAIKSVMSENASIYVHLDWHIGHYVKVMMDEIFGEENFRSEIIWKRSSAHSDNTDYANIHDAIFFYQIGTPIFNTPYLPYTEEYADQYYSKRDAKGRFKDTDLTAMGKQGGGYEYEWKGVRKVWICPVATMEEYDKKGLLYYTRNGTPRLKQYLSEMPGIPAQDLWSDIFPVNSQAKEKNDYATQKPEALLERIIKASSNEGMVVADFFGGSGVTAAVAAKSGRKFIHVDVNVNSVQTTRDRLESIGAKFDMMDVMDGVHLFRNPVQTMDKLKTLIPGLRDEASLNSFWIGAMHDSRLGMIPVYVPDLKAGGTSRLLDGPMMARILKQEVRNLPEGVKKAIVYYVEIDQEAVDKVRKRDKSTLVDVELRDLKDVLCDVVMDDNLEWEMDEKGSSELLAPQLFRVKSFESDYVRGKIVEFNEAGLLNAAKDKKFKEVKISDEGLEMLEAVFLDCGKKKGVFHADVSLKIDKFGYAILNGAKTGKLWDGTIPCPSKPLRIRTRNICGDESEFTC